MDQANDAQLQDIISGNSESSAELEARQTTNGPVFFDIAHDRSRLYVPQCHRHAVFNSEYLPNHKRSLCLAGDEPRNSSMGQNLRTMPTSQNTSTHDGTARRFGHIHLDLAGELFHAAPQEARAPDLVTALRNSMALLRPTPGTNHDSSRPIFVPTKLDTVSHVFVRIDAQHAPLQPRYEGPYAVLERRDKVFKLQLGNRTSWISMDRLKPAFVLLEP